ncbi:MAG: histidinol dehydrogenase [Alphaproteobacteria bacterium]|nr:histidinol dehydrogenase [Alphaproteobacteria bacterium SS10]
MPHRLALSDPDFDARFKALLGARQGSDSDAANAARDIIAQVRADGDAALIALTNRFDRLSLAAPDDLRLSPERLKAAAADCPVDVTDALRFAADRIRSFHEHQRPNNLLLDQDHGMQLGYRFTPMDAVGLYVPGGTAAYPSSLLMNAIPAQVAGVKRLVVTVPTPDDALSPALASALLLLGIDEIYRVGGAQAVAAVSYGTETIAPVDLVVGPGNAYVAAAKREVYGQVGIDSLAGPSEILVIADDSANPDWIAADLLSQAEHDEAAQSILITDDAAFADQVAEAVDRQLAALPRQEIAAASWSTHGAIITVPALADAIPLANQVAAEHVEIISRDEQALVDGIRHAGAIFIGAYSSEPIGDYVAGTNHVLPTAGSARFASGLGVMNFMKRTSLIRCTEGAFPDLAGPTIALAEAEGLGAHAEAIRQRLPKAAE